MAEEQNTEAATGAAPSKPGMMVLIGCLVAGLVVGGAGGAFALGPVLARKLSAPKATTEAASDEKSEEEHGGEKGEKKAANTVHMMENLVLNPAGSNGTRFLMAAVAAEVKDEKVNEEMTSRDAELRDAVLRILGDHTVDQLADMAIRETLKKIVTDSLNARLASKTAIKRVYFPQFVIQ
jgi:flagellar protein FliL